MRLNSLFLFLISPYLLAVSFTDLPSTINVNEGNLSVYTVKASDSSGRAITYSISGTDSGLFTITQSGGVLKFKTKKDFENPSDSNKDNIYKISVKAKTSASSVQKAVNVKVKNIDDEQPKITNFTNVVRVKENLQKVKTFTISDPDTVSRKLSIALAVDNDWPDKKYFTTNGKTLSFKNAPDYENAKDENKDNIYKIVVKAKDQAGNQKSYYLKVQVTNAASRNITYKIDTKNNIFIDDSTVAAHCTTNYDLWGEPTQYISPLAYGSLNYAAVHGYIGNYYTCQSGYREGWWMENSLDDYFINTQKEDPQLTIRLDQETDETPCNGSFYNHTPKCNLVLYVYKRDTSDYYNLYTYSISGDKTKSVTLPRSTANYLIRIARDGDSYEGNSNYVLHAYHKGSAPSTTHTKSSFSSSTDSSSLSGVPKVPSTIDTSSYNQEFLLAADVDESIIAPNLVELVPNEFIVAKRIKPSKRALRIRENLESKLTKSDRRLIEFAENKLLNQDGVTLVKLSENDFLRMARIQGEFLADQVERVNSYGNSATNKTVIINDDKSLAIPDSKESISYLTARRLSALFPEYEINPNYKVTTHAAFTPDKEYYPHQEQYMSTINFEYGLNLAGSETKNIYVGIIDTGGPTKNTSAWSTASWLENGDYDFLTSSSNGDGDGMDSDATDPSACMDCTYKGNGSHGTHVGTTISAKNDGLNINGFGVKTVALRALNVNGSGSYGEICNAIAYASNQTNDSGTTFAEESNGKKIKVINMSLGGGTSCPCQSTVTTAHNRGITVVASAGNSYNDGYNYPAACKNVISVSATNAHGSRSYFSTYNDDVDLAAPGGDTLLDYKGSVDGIYAFSKDDRLAKYQGTSMAAPMASGVLANIYAQNSKANSKFVHELLRKGLLTRDIGLEGKDIYYGHGLIDFEKAMTNAELSMSSVNTNAVLPNYVNLSTNSSKTFNINKKGSGTLKIVSVQADNPGLRIRKVNTNSSGFGTYSVSKISSNISRNDRFVSKIKVNIKNGVTTWFEEVPIYFQVGNNNSIGISSDLSFINLSNKVINSQKTHNLNIPTFKDSLNKRIKVEDGNYQICISTDLDFDGVYCEFGEVGYKLNNKAISKNETLAINLKPFFSN